MIINTKNIKILDPRNQLSLYGYDNYFNTFLIEFLLAPLWTLKTILLYSDNEVAFSVTFGEIIVSR